MPRGTLGLGLTFVLACISAAFFLLLRCEGNGRAFGPRSRWWGLSVIGLTGALSTGAAFAVVTVAHHLPSAFVSLGVVAPCGLWLGHIRGEGGGTRRNLYRDASTFWLTWLLARMHEGMAEDRLDWCEAHADPAWDTDELTMAARFYHDYLHERLSAEERRRYRIRWLMGNIETRLDVVRLIDGSAGRAKVVAALNASRLAQEARYRRTLDDLTRLGNLLRHDAERDLGRMLGAAYSVGFHRLEPYLRPAREAPRQDQRAGSDRSHP
jgi:hypothetical protein